MAPSETTTVIHEANTAAFSAYPVYYASIPSPLFTAPQGASPHFMPVKTLSPNSMHELSYCQHMLQGPPAPMQVNAQPMSPYPSTTPVHFATPEVVGDNACLG
ncbi:hypothetical protein V6N11_059044 [Hibiscus sabdariffa]|uniref:Uncharacterized protein n=1 Tax=Hibiscus sabdariffa TaxID=183260 RepID=A0ABR2U684_9ROSI